MKKRPYGYAGLKEVFRTGLPVEGATTRLRRFAYIEERLMFLQAAHVVGVAHRDFKVLLGRLQYLDGLHADGLRQRVSQLRTPKGSLDATPDAALATLLDEAIHAHSAAEVVATTRWLKRELREAYGRYLATTNHLADSPSVDLLKTVLAQEKESLTWLDAAHADLVKTTAEKREVKSFLAHLEPYLLAAGGLDGTQPCGVKHSPKRATQPFQIQHVLKRDATFRRVWDFEKPDTSQTAKHLAYMMSIRLSEINVAEGLAIVLCETPNMPWDFYFDISRHLWDEVRHSLLGEAAIEATMGERGALPIRDYEGVYCMEASPLEQYATLGVGIEGGNMKYPPGKRSEWEFCRDNAKHPLMTTFQDFDWADEVLHVNIAYQKLGEWFQGGPKALAAFAEEGKAHRTQVKKRHPAEPVPAPAKILPRSKKENAK